MRFLLFTLIIFMTYKMAYSQYAIQREWKIGVSTGWTKSRASDLLLNHYTYSGDSFLNFKMFGSFNRAKHHFQVQLTGNRSTLYPDNFNQVYYEYNYLDQSMVELSISYLHVIINNSKNIQVAVGASNSSFYSVQDELHRNILYPYGLDHRKSYVISPMNLMPTASVGYSLGKNTLNAVFSYSLVNVFTRPDDTYVKQIGINKGRSWSIYFPDEFLSFRYSLQYQYKFRKLSATIGYEVLYNSIDGACGFQYLHKMVLAGVTILI